MLAITSTDGGPANWAVQPRQAGIVLVKGTTYVVKFNAMASIARNMQLSITQDGGGFASYSGEQSFALTTEMQQLSFEFTMNADPPVENCKFEMRLGGGANNPSVPNTVYIDNVSITPKP